MLFASTALLFSGLSVGSDRGDYGIGASPIIAHHNASDVLAVRHHSIVKDFLRAMSTSEGWTVMRQASDSLVEQKASPDGWPVYVKSISTVPAPAAFVYNQFEWLNFEATQKVLDPFVDYIRLVAAFKEERGGESGGDGEEEETVVRNVLYRKEMNGPPLLPKRVFNTVLRADKQHGTVVLPRGGKDKGKKRGTQMVEIADGTLMHSCIDVRLPLLEHRRKEEERKVEVWSSRKRFFSRVQHALELALEEDGYQDHVEENDGVVMVEEPLHDRHALSGSSDDVNMVRTAEDIARMAETPS